LYGRSLDDQNISFIIVGDWGLKCELQSIVAQQMAKIAQQIKAQFIINTGDNFYSFGVSSINDPQFRQVFEEKFTQDSEFNRLPW
jgi:tartrate-resistant acid phosphatase type 5